MPFSERYDRTYIDMYLRKYVGPGDALVRKGLVGEVGGVDIVGDEALVAEQPWVLFAVSLEVLNFAAVVEARNTT